MAIAENEIVRNEPPTPAEAKVWGQRAWEIYHAHRSEIETSENIGKLIVIDTDSGDYEIAADEYSFEADRRLRARHPKATLFGLRVGYNAVYAFGSTLERLPT